MIKEKLFFLFCFTFLFDILSITAQNEVRSYVYEGNRYFEKGSYEQASSRYLDAVKINASDFSGHYNLGNSFYKREMYDEAKAEYEKAGKLAKNRDEQAKVLYNLGNVEMQRRDYSNAVGLYRSALVQNPYSEVIRKNYQLARLKQQEHGNGADENKYKENGNSAHHSLKTDNQSHYSNNVQNLDKKRKDIRNNKSDDAQPSQERYFPKKMEEEIINGIEHRERKTVRRFLNNKSYSVLQNKEKDW